MSTYPTFTVFLRYICPHSISAGDKDLGTSPEKPVKILVAYGSVGGSVLRLCEKLMAALPDRYFEIDYSDPTANNLQVLQTLLSDKKLQW